MLRFFGTKIGLSLAAALVIVGGATYIKLRTPSAAAPISSKVSLIADESVKKAIQNGQIDTSDWEKALEAIQGSSTIDEKIAALGQASAVSGVATAPLTATDRFAQRFFTEYVKLKESGQTIDENTGVSLVNKLLGEDYGSAPLEKVYTAADIRISTDVSISGLRIYGNSLGSALSQATPANYENEIAIINRAYETEDTKNLEKLAQNIDYYQKMRAAVEALPVPAPLKTAHVAFLNSLSAVIDGVRGMKLLGTDPVGATKMILRYEDGIKAVDLSTRQISAYLKKQSITFSPAESGYIFVE